jgi:hypothetical protein
MAAEKTIHYYHADTTAFGGHIYTPFDRMVPVIAPLSLPPVGGYAVARAEKYCLEGIFSFESAYTQVAGSVSRKNRAWTTLATAAVEGLNILDVISADRIVAQIATEHPRDDRFPKVTFIGTQFENLRIAGYPVEITVDPNLLGQNPGVDQFPKVAIIDDESFTNKWDNSQLKQRAAIRCSVVTEVKKVPCKPPFGHVLEIPDIGKVFLGELLLDRYTYRLIAIRLELGCTTCGALSGPTASIEGQTW